MVHVISTNSPAESLHLLMRASGFTARTLGQAIGCSESLVRHWLNEYSEPSAERRERIAFVLGADPYRS